MKGRESCDGMIEMSARVSRKHETTPQSVAGNGNRVGADLTRQSQSVTGKLMAYSPRNMICRLKCIVTLPWYMTRQGDETVLNIISYNRRNVILWLEGRVQFPGTLTRQSRVSPGTEAVLDETTTALALGDWSLNLMEELGLALRKYVAFLWKHDKAVPEYPKRMKQYWRDNNLKKDLWVDNWRSVAIPWKCDKTAPGRLSQPWRRTIQSQCWKNYFRFSNAFF